MLDASKLERPEEGGDAPRLRLPRAAKKHRGPLQPAALLLKASSKEYCSTAAIHGVRYFVEDGRTLFERAFWALSLTASLAGCAIMIHKVYHKWGSNPVVVAPAEIPRPMSDVPFPAVTICPETKWPMSEFNFTDIKHRMNNDSSPTDEELDRYGTARAVCPLARLYGGPPVTNASLYSLFELAKLGQVYCWFDYDFGCEFHRFISDDGPCFTFNMLSSEELFTSEALQYSDSKGTASKGWDNETWTPKQNHPEGAVFPLRTYRVGDMSGFKVVLEGNTSDIDYACNGYVQGYKVILHSPAEIPSTNTQYYRVGHNQALNVVVTPSIMTTDADVKDYTSDVRKCYMQNERRLRFFKVYSQAHCKLECLANFTEQTCGCTSFFAPRTANTTICATSVHASCIRRVNAIETSIIDACHCLPACTTLEYNAHTIKADYEWNKYSDTVERTSAFPKPDSGNALSEVTVFFKDMQVIPTVRCQNEFYGLTDLLASCGGLLSLFNGFSLISLVEIVYYATIRLWCNVYRSHRRRSQAVADPAVKAASLDVEKQKESQA